MDSEGAAQKISVSSYFNVTHCHPEWRPILINALEMMDHNYLEELKQDNEWLPGQESLFAAFSLPWSRVRYILLGESPYPRKDSANGYAFWDSAVGSLWSEKGLSTAVNRATSLRHLMKMFLVARGDLESDVSQARIAQLNKSALVQTGEELFQAMMAKGILLLNATLVYQEGKVPFHARFWKPFMKSLLTQLVHVKPDIQLILLGKIAETVPHDKLPIGLISEHPYNISFVTNQRVIDFFKPLDLLHR